MGKKSKSKKLSEAKSSIELKLDLACGAHCKAGFEGVDQVLVKGATPDFPDTKHVVDLMKFPWPWADSSIDEIHCSHFIEHLPARNVEPRDCHGDGLAYHDGSKYVGKDFLFAFFDECWRVLKHQATLTIICPSARSERGFQDPTHRRFIVLHTFAYMAWPERHAMGLDHYKVDCDFEMNVVFTHDGALAARAQEVQQRLFNESWNAVMDYVATMKVMKPARG